MTAEHRRPVLWVVVLVALVLAGCFGLWRGDYYGGVTTGELEACVPFSFDLSIEEGGAIAGWATTEYRWGTVSWEIRGQVGPQGELRFETWTEDPRVAQRRLIWRESRHLARLEIAQEGGAGCSAPRHATLHKK